MHKRFHGIFAIWYSNGTDAIAVSHKYLFIAGKEKSFFQIFFHPFKFLWKIRIEMYLSNFDASIICTTSKGKVQCLFLSFAQSYHIPFQMHIQRSKHAYVSVKRAMYLDTSYCIQRICSASNWCKSKFQSSNSLMSRADNRTQLLLNLSSNI